MAKDEVMSLEKKTCVTPEARLSFPSLFKPRSFDGQEPRFECDLILPKNADLTGLKKIIHNAKVEKWGPNKEKWPKGLMSPVKDGAEREDLDGYGPDVFYIKPWGKRAPAVVGGKKNGDGKFPALEPDDIYAGCFVRAEVVAFAYDTKGKKGVGLGLRKVQKLRDGDPFGGGTKAEEAFEEVEDTSDDEDSYSDDDNDGDGDDDF